MMYCEKIEGFRSSLRRLFEGAQDGILILGAETGLIEDVNPYLVKMPGYSREEFIETALSTIPVLMRRRTTNISMVKRQNKDHQQGEIS